MSLRVRLMTHNVIALPLTVVRLLSFFTALNNAKQRGRFEQFPIV